MAWLDVTWLDAEYFGNPLSIWLMSGALAAGAIIVLELVKAFLVLRLGKLASRFNRRVDNLLVELIRAVRFASVFAVAIYLATRLLVLPARVGELVSIFMTVVLAYQAACWGHVLIDEWLARNFARQDVSGRGMGYGAVRFVARVVLWAIVLLLALDNLGIEVTALIAGLGVGGIAVALAVQNILGDIFNSLSIVLDKPFEVGDFVVVDDMPGTVENIGVKTTRVRSLGGEQLVFSNSDLVASRIRNYGRMRERRIVFGFGITYQTPAAEVEAIPKTVRSIIEGLENTRFDRAHFKEFGESALNFEVVYYVLSSDFNVYMDHQQSINLALMRAFEARGIDFAFPTRTLYVEKLGPNDAALADNGEPQPRQRAEGERREPARR